MPWLSLAKNPDGRGKEFRVAVNGLSEYQYEGSVYNLKVDQDSTYNVNGFVVHNCEKVLRAHGWKESTQALEEKPPDDKPIWCDAATICQHIDVNTGKVYTLPPTSKPAVRRYAVGDKAVLDLGCGEIASTMAEGLPVRCDMRDDVNADYRCDIRVLPFKSESYDIVFSSHTLEHFSRKQIPDVLAEWLRVLKPGGFLRLVVPDLKIAAQEILDGKISEATLNVMYGQQDFDWNFHKMGFSAETLEALLKSQGLEIVKIWSEPPFNLFAEAKKVQALSTVGSGQGRCIDKADVKEVLAAQEVQKQKEAAAEAELEAKVEQQVAVPE